MLQNYSIILLLDSLWNFGPKTYVSESIRLEIELTRRLVLDPLYNFTLESHVSETNGIRVDTCYGMLVGERVRVTSPWSMKNARGQSFSVIGGIKGRVVCPEKSVSVSHGASPRLHEKLSHSFTLKSDVYFFLIAAAGACPCDWQGTSLRAARSRHR